MPSIKPSSSSLPPGFAAPSHISRISRDVFLYDRESGDFLVKPWAGGGHISKAQFGNAFGTFLCRPPKSKEDLDAQLKHHAKVKTSSGKGKKKVLTYDVGGGIVGHKTESLSRALPNNRQPSSFGFACVRIPSMTESAASLVHEPMTVLAYFAPVSKRSTRLEDGAYWVSVRDATDPSKNLHANVISAFLCTPPQKEYKVLRGKNVLAIQRKVRDMLGGDETAFRPRA